MALVGWSALTQTPVSCDTALTGELSVCGRIMPVGGVPEKIQAAEKLGLKRVLIPDANRQDRHADMGIEVIPVSTLSEVISLMTSEDASTPQLQSAPIPSPLPAAAARANGQEPVPTAQSS